MPSTRTDQPADDTLPMALSALGTVGVAALLVLAKTGLADAAAAVAVLGMLAAAIVMTVVIGRD